MTYDAILEMTDADEAVKDGMTCEISFILSQRKDVLLIPNKAVEFTDGNQYVQVLLADGTIEERVISTGLTDGRNVEVTKGLSEGDTLLYETLSKE